MTKADRTDAIAASSGITKKAAAAVLNAITAVITDELMRRNPVAISGFGAFRISRRAARIGVNPRNPSEKINIPARNLPVFKAGKALKEAVR